MVTEVREKFNITEAIDYFRSKIQFSLGPVELNEMVQNKECMIVDVRSREAYSQGHIPGAISIPKDELVENLDRISSRKMTVVYCYTQQCHLAAKSALILAKHGYPVMELEGGFDSWKNEYNFEVVQ